MSGAWLRNRRVPLLLALLGACLSFAVRLHGQEAPRYLPEFLPPPEAIEAEPRAILLPPISDADLEAYRRRHAPVDSEERGRYTGGDRNLFGVDLGLQELWTKLVAPGARFLEDHNLLITGRLHVDGAFFGAGQEVQTGRGGVGNLVDTANIRRARIALCGHPHERINWVSELGFEAAFDGVTAYPGLVNVFVEATDLPWIGNFRIGHFKEPFSLEALSSSNSIPFMERSSPFDAFVPFRNLGAMIFDTALDDRMTWASGIFRTNSQNTRTPLNKGDGEYASTTRVTYLPWFKEDGKYWMHLGAAYSYRGFFSGAKQTGRFRAFPGIRTGRHIFNDTGAFLTDSVNVTGAEFGLNLGALNLQAEYYHVWLRDAVIKEQIFNPQFHGWYVQASYFLTGEHRLYQHGPGAVLRPCPSDNCFWLRRNGFGNGGNRLGWGAWEVAARYSRLNVDDSDQNIEGQVLQTITLGLNWYVNPNARLMWNYVLAGRSFPAASNQGVVHIFAMRLHIDF